MKPDKLAAARAIDAFLRAIGRDPDSDPLLVGTAERVASAFLDDLVVGEGVDPASVLLPHITPGHTGVVALRDVAVATVCPHHLLPALGVGTVAFGPRDKLVGLGALAELLNACSRRLTFQETIGEEVAKALVQATGARWAACRLVMRHACISARGERQHRARAETVAFLGDVAYRAEAFAVVGAGA
jgi:GTP cyclohydrolase IA